MEDDQPSEFEKEFAAISAAKDAAAAQAAAPAPAPAPAPSEAAPAEASAPPAPTPAPAAAPAPAPSETPPTTEELQRQLADMSHRERSSANRVSAFMRENQDLKRMLAELKSKVDQIGAQAPTPAPAPAPAEDVLTNAPDLDAAVRKRAVEVTSALEKQVKDLTQRVNTTEQAASEVRQVVEPIRQQNHQSQIESTHAVLDRQFGERWRQDVRSNDFAEWISLQPPSVQQDYEHAITPAESAAVMARYYAGRTASAPPPPAPAPAGNTQQDRLRNAAGIAPRGNARPPTGPAEDDFEGHFAVATQAIRKSA